MTSRRFVISDTHFHHNNILEYCRDTREGHTCIHAMNEDMVDRWNDVVRPSDTVYHLGDVVLGGAKNLDIVKQLNGHKKLIIGNHDYVRSNMRDYLEVFESVEAYREFGHHFIIMSHYPVHPSQMEDEWTASGKPRYVFNFHGHVHDKTIRLPNGDPNPRYVNCCADANDLVPQEMEYMIEIAKARMATFNLDQMAEKSD